MTTLSHETSFIHSLQYIDCNFSAFSSDFLIVMLISLFTFLSVQISFLVDLVINPPYYFAFILAQYSISYHKDTGGFSDKVDCLAQRIVRLIIIPYPPINRQNRSIIQRSMRNETEIRKILM